jgi:P-type Ca2+ transporter type 2C
VQHKDAENLEKHGGVIGIAEALHTDTVAGLDPAATGDLSIESRRATFGSNKFKEVRPKSFFLLWFENLCDPTLILLMIAAAVRLFKLGT